MTSLWVKKRQTDSGFPIVGILHPIVILRKIGFVNQVFTVLDNWKVKSDDRKLWLK